MRYDLEEKDDQGKTATTMAVEVLSDGLRFTVNPWGDGDESNEFSFFFRGNRQAVWNWLEALQHDVEDSMSRAETEECSWDKVGSDAGKDVLACVLPHECENKAQAVLPGISA